MLLNNSINSSLDSNNELTQSQICTYTNSKTHLEMTATWVSMAPNLVLSAASMASLYEDCTQKVTQKENVNQTLLSEIRQVMRNRDQTQVSLICVIGIHSWSHDLL